MNASSANSIFSSMLSDVSTVLTTSLPDVLAILASLVGIVYVLRWVYLRVLGRYWIVNHITRDKSRQ